MSNLTAAQIAVLEKLEDADQMTRKELGCNTATIQSLVDEGYVIAVTTNHQIANNIFVENVYFRLREEGSIALEKALEEAADKPKRVKKEAQPEREMSETLFNCLIRLEGADWLSYTDLNTSNQNIQRLAASGWATVKITADHKKMVKITEEGLAALNRNR